MSAQSGLILVVEGATDACIIRTILGKEVAGKLRFFAGQGRASLATVARNLLVHEGGPLLMVMDSDTRNQHLVEELQSMAMAAMSGVAAGGAFRVITFVPEIEVVFFEAPQSLELILSKTVPADMVQEGLLIPKETLARLFGEPDYQRLLSDSAVAKAIRSGKQARALAKAVDSLLRAHDVPATAAP